MLAMAVRAQTITPQIKVSLVVKPFQSIQIGSGSVPGDNYAGLVSFEYSSHEHYAKGGTKTVERQLRVSSIGTGYTVGAEWLNDGKFYRVGAGSGAERIPVGEILQIAIAQAGEPMGAPKDVEANMPAVYTSTEVVSPFTELDVMYRAKPLMGNEDLIRRLLGPGEAISNPSTYAAHVRYTIVPN